MARRAAVHERHLATRLDRQPGGGTPLAVMPRRQSLREVFEQFRLSGRTLDDLGDADPPGFSAEDPFEVNEFGVTEDELLELASEFDEAEPSSLGDLLREAVSAHESRAAEPPDADSPAEESEPSPPTGGTEPPQHST